VIVGERLLQSNENFPARYKLNSHTTAKRKVIAKKPLAASGARQVARQSRKVATKSKALDCRVAALLAMTGAVRNGK